MRQQEQERALARLEKALAQVAVSGVKLRGEGAELLAIGLGVRRVRVRHDLETGGIYQALVSKPSEARPPVAKLWDFDGRQRRAIVALEAAFVACEESGLCLLHSETGLLALEQQRLEAAAGEGLTLSDLQEEMEMVQDSGAWR